MDIFNRLKYNRCCVTPIPWILERCSYTALFSVISNFNIIYTRHVITYYH